MNKFIDNVLEKYEYSSIHELIFELIPKGYNIPAAYIDINELSLYPLKTKVTLFGYIDSYEIQPIKTRKAISRIKARLYKDGQSTFLYWTVSKEKARGMVYGLEQRSKDGALVQVSGKIEEFKVSDTFNLRYIEQPQINRISSQENSTETFLNPEPLYKLKDGIKLSQIQLAFKEISENWDSIDKKHFLPEELEKTLNMQPIHKSLQYVHGLASIQADKLQSFLNYDGFRKRLSVEKIWTIMKEGYTNKNISGNSDFEWNEEDTLNVKKVLEKLPFNLTGDQKKAIWGLFKHFEKKASSKNLVFGDVGSGKTMVALIVSYVLLQRGFQSAILTPTSILAKQHYEEAKELFPEENIFLVHSKTTKKEKEKINEILRAGKPTIVYGTSSLNKLDFTNLNLVVIDEEQKFGVKDKELLYEKSNAHLILMTATPIPRTLAGAMFTDFAVHKIEEKPAMQKARLTKIANLNDMSENEIKEISNRMRNGEQTLVVVPSIVSNDMISVAVALDKYKKFFPEFKIDSINGRMKSENIESVTESFMNGDIDILIATTMVDAGFSNKKLSHVFIENCERFGIAQLHQIRGRVGRGSLQGYCYLSTMVNPENLKSITQERLLSLVGSENGFELSMKDIALRGSGDLTGIEQSGSDINLIEWLKEIEIIESYLKNKGNEK